MSHHGISSPYGPKLPRSGQANGIRVRGAARLQDLRRKTTERLGQFLASAGSDPGDEHGVADLGCGGAFDEPELVQVADGLLDLGG